MNAAMIVWLDTPVNNAPTKMYELTGAKKNDRI